MTNSHGLAPVTVNQPHILRSGSMLQPCRRLRSMFCSGAIGRLLPWGYWQAFTLGLLAGFGPGAMGRILPWGYWQDLICPGAMGRIWFAVGLLAWLAVGLKETKVSGRDWARTTKWSSLHLHDHHTGLRVRVLPVRRRHERLQRLENQNRRHPAQ